MRLGKIDFPESLLNALRSDKLVVFAGAGVSMGKPANLPSFQGLAKLIAKRTGEPIEKGEPEDRFLGRLQYQQIKIHELVAEELGSQQATSTPLHHNILRLFPDAERLRIVTTNFDLLFEQAAEEVFGRCHEAYSGPILPLGRDFRGIVHIHGSLNKPQEMVLTDADFGQAYLVDSWATRFLIEVFHNYTVLFIGYSHNDVVMHYLGRALSANEQTVRLALTQESDKPERWKRLGIWPSTYPMRRKNDHSALFHGVAKLAQLVARNILDWRRELTDLASNPPPLDEELAGMIDYAFRDEATTRFFTDHGRLPEWPEWLAKRHHLDALFKHGKLDQQGKLLSQWLARKYAGHCTNDLLLLIGHRGMQLNEEFWSTLGYTIAFDECEDLDTSKLARWITLLLHTAPATPQEDLLLELGKFCTKLGAIDSLLLLFEKMTESRIQVRRGIVWPSDIESEEKRKPIDFDITFYADHYNLQEFWEKCLKPNLEHIAPALLPLIIRQLEKPHYLLRSWDKGDREWDLMNFRRAAIEPHEQDRIHAPIDALIDISRDCLEWMLRHHPTSAKHWLEPLALAETPILRRLALHVLDLRTDLAASEKIDWLLERYSLHDDSAHHEIHRVLRSTYTQLGTASRRRIIIDVLAYEWGDHEDPQRDKRSARVQYDWLRWLHDADSECDLVNNALNEISTRYPEFEPSDHPDVTRWVSVGWHEPQSPYSVEELLAKPATEWITTLLSFKGEDPFGPNRSGLAFNVTEAAKTKADWGYELAAGLTNDRLWDCYLWPALMRAWTNIDLDMYNYSKAFDYLRKPELQGHHPQPIADVLYALVKEGGRSYAATLLSHANEIATGLWLSLDRTQNEYTNSNWFHFAINRPAGILGLFWLQSLSIWRKQQNPRPNAFNENYRQALTAMAQDPATPGRHARAVLLSEFSFLLAADETWTKIHLIPLLDGQQGDIEFQVAWEGFLAGGQYLPSIAETLENASLNAVIQLTHLLSHQRARFIEWYTGMIGFYINNPMQEWIPRLFRIGNAEDRSNFASNLKGHLQSMNEAEQIEWWTRWLKCYWQERIKSVPAPLAPGEIARMLEWLPHLTAVYPEAVDLAIHMPKLRLERVLLIYMLKKKDELVRKYPQETACLLIYLGDLDMPEYNWHGIKELITLINMDSLESSLQKKFEEFLARHGW